MELRAVGGGSAAPSPALRGFVGGNELAPQRFVCQAVCRARRDQSNRCFRYQVSLGRWTSASSPPCSPSPTTARSRPRPSAAHGAVQRLHPRRPPRARARRHPDRPATGARPTEAGQAVIDRARRITPSSAPSSPTWPRWATEVVGRIGAPRRHRHHRPARRRRCSRTQAAPIPARSTVVIIDATTTSWCPSWSRRPRPGRGQSARRPTRTSRSSRSSTRTAS